MESNQRIRSLSMEMQEAVQEQTQLRSGVLQHEGTIAELRAENGRLDEEVRALREDGRERSASKPEMTSKVLELELQTVVFPVFRMMLVV